VAEGGPRYVPAKAISAISRSQVKSGMPRSIRPRSGPLQNRYSVNSMSWLASA
jgi:hypothetical protein